MSNIINFQTFKDNKAAGIQPTFYKESSGHYGESGRLPIKTYEQRRAENPYYDTGLKLMKRSGIFKAENVRFDPKTCEAYSYDWWRFVEKIKGKVVFNSYRYSVSTSKHQSKVRSLLKVLKIKIDIEIEARCGLQKSLELAANDYQSRIQELKIEIANPRSQKRKNLERKAEIKHFEKLIANCLKLEAKRGAK